jgi:hypothetical protein
MRLERFRAQALVSLFRSETLATMDEMKRCLGTGVDMTVFRKLRGLDYLTSYSHRGRFYTLRELAEFDDRGLWAHRGVHFSRFGSLVETAERFVIGSERGFLVSELAQELEVEVKEPLLGLVRAKRLAREEFSGLYLYCSADPVRRRQQLLARRLPVAVEPFGMLQGSVGTASDETKAAIILFLSTLDEKQRRLYAGLESMRIGRGGDREIAELTGLDVHTVARGRRELKGRDLKLERIRRPGGGRKAVEKKRKRRDRHH